MVGVNGTRDISVANTSHLFFCANHPLFGRDYTRNIMDRLQIFVIEGNAITLKKDFYAKIKITGTNDH
jgi:hypothetical protein